MKILYMAFGIDGVKCESDGVYKKILGQKKVFNENFDKCDVWLVNGFDIYQMDEFNIVKKIENMEQSILEYDIAYLRMALGERAFHTITQYLAKTKLKVFVEVPTFNFSQEMLLHAKKMWKQKQLKEAVLGILGMAIHKWIYFPRMLTRIDSLVTIAHEEKLRFVSHINIDNGIDIRQIEKKKIRNEDQEFKMIVVANLSVWHGIDRVITGIYKYICETGNRDIKLTIVGTGKEEQSLKDLVRDYNLEENVCFVGKKMGEELDRYFDEADVAVSTLAFFRTGMMKASTLKSREYCARGIPYIVTDVDWEERIQQYVFKVPHNESPLEIAKIREWYTEIEDKEKISEKMREYAEEHYTWNKQLDVVIDAMKASVSN